jgi:hypothetical protein
MTMASAPSARARCDLEAYEAAADDGETRARQQLRPQLLGIGQVA